jgi:ubiquinone/menaquinone biosynthesis C-methylase UbiE
MGFYAKFILPRCIDLAMSNKESCRLRAQWIPRARGQVLEIGAGSGLNLRFYTSQVTRVVALEPSPQLQRMARERASQSTVPVEFLSQTAEETLPLAPQSIDTIVLTWTLCSIAGAAQALQRARDVLKEDGQLIFVEHGRSPDPRVAAWQDRLTPFWKRIGGGCHLNRQIDQLVTTSGFRIRELTTSYLPGPRPMTFIYQGLASRD